MSSSTWTGKGIRRLWSVVLVSGEQRIANLSPSITSEIRRAVLSSSPMDLGLCPLFQQSGTPWSALNMDNPLCHSALSIPLTITVFTRLPLFMVIEIVIVGYQRKHRFQRGLKELQSKQFWASKVGTIPKARIQGYTRPITGATLDK
ncbi:hypothetical protein EDB81DRAFT_939469 [Dactylonectria macrodidyma]|uniref:Uncharacterized protein n=1 Tax=Dactylonectria macrodidyma TaxID=307937 RepID=A0A9P9JHU4_9HYPO|nr:hypothetical protein EDB81DRAFT_939469 [Dactylonectria macrodidyma]